MMEPTKSGRVLEQEVDDYLAQRHPDLVDVEAFDPMAYAAPRPSTSRPRRPRKARKKSPTAGGHRPAKKASAKKAKKTTRKKATKRPAKRAKPRKKTARSTKKRAGAGRRAGARKRRPAKKKAKKHRATAATDPPPAASPLSVVLEAVRSMPSAGRFGPERVYISDAYHRVGRRLGMSLPQFKAWLVGENREANLSLARADSRGDMPADKLDESEIRDLGAEFHFILDPSKLGRGRY